MSLRSKKAGSPHPTPLRASFLVIQGQRQELEEEPGDIQEQGLSHIQEFKKEKSLNFLGACKLQNLEIGMRE